MLFPDHFLAVRAKVNPERDADFNKWYDTEHTPDAVKAFPGCIGGARYKVMLGDGSHQYVALYAFKTAEAMERALTGPEVKKLIAVYDAEVGSFSTRERTTYSKILECMAPV
jgi:antibiotic biosynthesis monooxygenase (ABM) superfamily enzyme